MTGLLPLLALALGAPAPPADATVRCSTVQAGPARSAFMDGSDCSLAQTNPGPQWEPAAIIRIPVVVHVIMDTACAQGVLTDVQVTSQIDILNEDFRALAGTPGALGYDTKVEFVLATQDPQGAPTSGITRDCNSAWYADQGSYWNTLAWDPTRYLNLYTNTAANARGYVPFLPADPAGAVGQPQDRVVINTLAIGRNGPVPAHNQGRTATHEIGHYLGLFHPYFDGCGIDTPPDCYTTGDRICDTPPDAMEHHGCTAALNCGSFPVPIENYMELTDDTCATGFTHEQARRIRCTLATYRSTLVTLPDALFRDGFDSGGLTAWSAHLP